MAAELAVATVLVIGAGLMARSAWQLATRDRGFLPAGVWTARIALPSQGYDVATTSVFYQQLAARLQAVPGTTTQSLQELIDCHIARARASGTATTLADGSPLTLAGVVAKVGWMADGFAVNLTADDPYVVQELVRWAHGLPSAE